MREEHTRASFLETLHLDIHDLVRPQQIHGSAVHIVTDRKKREIPGVDGVVSRLPGIVLGVLTADCVPILMRDRKKHVIGAVHAGWKGTLGNIAEVAVKAMEKCGSLSRDIEVSIGPHIGGCCYTVPDERAQQFHGAYGTDDRIAFLEQGTWHLDIGYVNWLQLRSTGVLSEHIKAPVVCTSCRSDIFYSYRKDTKESFGEMLNVITYGR